MSIGAALMPEFEQEMTKTRETLQRVPTELFGWKPHEKSFSFGDLANHLARLPGWGAATLETESMNLDPEAGEFVPPEPGGSTEEVLAIFDEQAEAFRKALSGAGDDAFMAPWTLANGEDVLFTLPRVAVIRGMILNHVIHHRGQLTVYLRLNDLPVPSLYGPSADEKG